VLTPTVQAAPNPTLQNEREGTPELTAMDQGSSAAETTITANIRKGVMAQQALSFTARNVKVVTVGSRVTLRGAVSSADEKNVIAALARGTSGVSEVDDQLEVKP
jgi:osmotically-inducible protein OsmY